MHEFAIIEGILETVTEAAAENHLTRVTQVNLVIGRLHQLVPDMLEFSFQVSTRGTVAEDCILEIEWRTLMVTCKDCHTRSEIIDSIFICPHCGSFRLKMESGKELFVKSIIGE